MGDIPPQDQNLLAPDEIERLLHVLRSQFVGRSELNLDDVVSHTQMKLHQHQGELANKFFVRKQNRKASMSRSDSH